MKKFNKEGSIYKLKPQLGMNIPLIGAFVILTIAGFTKMPESSFKWWMMGISLVLFVSVLRSYLIIDLDRKEIRIRAGFLGSSKTIPLETLLGFSVHKIKQYGFITINVSLIANYINSEGKDKTVALAQAFFTRPIQNILNDIDEILGDEHQR